MCQYPNSDNFHFYEYYGGHSVEKEMLCQYPKSDNTHFYKDLIKFVEFLNECVNTLNRITLISTLQLTKKLIHTNGCQYPKSDNFHFYGTFILYFYNNSEACQYPNSDNFHFYEYNEEIFIRNDDVSIP